MKYITKRNSATGKKFAEAEKKMNECFDVQIGIAKKYKIKQWRRAIFSIAGGFSSVLFAPNASVDTKVWKNVNGRKDEWMPRGNSKIGKEIIKEFEAMPVVTARILNLCIGYPEPINNIGFARNNDQYYGFTVDEDWGVKVPSDCKEVTTTEYNKLFQPKKDIKVAKRQRSVATAAK